VDAARAAGLKVVALTTGYPADRLAAADAVLTRFEDLDLGLLDRLVCRPPSPRP
jgi:beta-phosphoglucomutase-like phosphatase (HAD superfamily)